MNAANDRSKLMGPGQRIELVVYKTKANFTVYMGCMEEMTLHTNGSKKVEFILEGFHEGATPIQCAFVDGKPGKITRAAKKVRYPVPGIALEKQTYRPFLEKVTAPGTFLAYDTKTPKSLPGITVVVSLDEVKQILPLTAAQMKRVTKGGKIKRYTCILSPEVGTTAATLKDLNAQLAEMHVRLIPITHLYDEPHHREVSSFVSGMQSVLQME
jgi:hypothetical protein